MIVGKIFNLSTGKMEDHAFCDICGWGDILRTGVEIPGHGTYDLCYRCDTPKKFMKRLKLFSAYRILKSSASFEEKKKLLNSVDSK